MKTAKIVYIVFLISILLSCNFHYREASVLKSKTKNINGVIYTFSSFFTQKSTEITYNRIIGINSSVELHGFKRLITMDIVSDEFEKKLDLSKIDSIKIDSVSFTIDQEKLNIDLFYYLTVNDKNKTLVFSLFRNNESWELR